ncbi:hypothetical protein RFI_10361, partial [Reticulomyxa filosa]
DTPKIDRSVALLLDEVGLAEQSFVSSSFTQYKQSLAAAAIQKKKNNSGPNRPLKVLHKLLEDENSQDESKRIAFLGLSNWILDAAKMNRMVDQRDTFCIYIHLFICLFVLLFVFHKVVQVGKEELISTANAIIQSSKKDSKALQKHLMQRVPKIVEVYESLRTDNDAPFEFDFYGHRDFYFLADYLKYTAQKRRCVNEELLVEAMMRNFGGMTKRQTEEFLFPKIKAALYSINEFPSSEVLWNQFSPLHLIQNNIQQTQQIESPDMRNIMLIAESPAVWRILFDPSIASTKSTEVIFGSKFSEDRNSTIYCCRIIEKIRHAMSAGKVCILLKLEQFYESLYDILNQRYQEVDGQKFCNLSIQGESIRCRIAKTFRCVVVMSKVEAFHQTKNTNLHTPVEFLSRFEKYFLDPNLLEYYDTSLSLKDKLRVLEETVRARFGNPLQLGKLPLFAGFLEKFTYFSLLTRGSIARHKDKDKDTVNDEEQLKQALHLLLQNMELQYMIGDRCRNGRDFVPYADIV